MSHIFASMYTTVYTGIFRYAQWYNSVSGGGVILFYLVSSSSTGVAIPSICSPLSDFENTVTRVSVTVAYVNVPEYESYIYDSLKYV